MNLSADLSPATGHINRAFDEHMGETLGLGQQLKGKAERALAGACAALRAFDRVLAKEIIDADPATNRLASELVVMAAKTISLHQPVARDMRLLVGWIQLSIEYERLADHAKNICKRICTLANENETPMFHEGLNRLGDLAVQQFAAYAAAEAAGDADAVVEVWRSDSAIDDAYRVIVRQAYAGDLLEPQHALIQSLFIAKNFERIGDKVCNLAEITRYVIAGEIIDLGDDQDRTD